MGKRMKRSYSKGQICQEEFNKNCSSLCRGVAFDGEDSVAVVPDIWKRGNQCCWPPYKGLQRIRKAVQQEEIPANDWDFYTCRVLYSGLYIEAEKKLRKAEETSDLQSEEEVIPAKRKKFAPRRLAESDTDNSCEEEDPVVGQPIPTPPRALPALPILPTPPPALPMRQSGRVTYQPQITPTPPQASSSDPYFSRSQEARDMRIFKLLEVMNETLKDNNRLLRLILSQRVGGAEAAAPPELPEAIVFPVTTVEEMEVLNAMLQDEATASSVVKYLADLGGRDIQDTVARTLRTTIDTNLARQYNFKGLKGKKQFEGLKITGIIYRCLRMNPVTRQATVKDMEAAIIKWLAGARDRSGGRRARMPGTPPAATESPNTQ